MTLSDTPAYTSYKRHAIPELAEYGREIERRLKIERDTL